MIRFVRSACVAPGKFGDALAFAWQISEFVSKHYGVKLEIMLPVGGNPQRIAWRAEYSNLGAMDEFQSKLLWIRSSLSSRPRAGLTLLQDQ